jgi:hypothetical protein
MKADKSHRKPTLLTLKKGAPDMSSMLLTEDATAEQRELLSRALSDAVFYRDPPLTCAACPSPDQLCDDCAAGLASAREYVALSRAFGVEPPPSGA